MTIEDIIAWLDSKGVTLWGTFDLSQPERKIEAAVWFHDQLMQAQAFTFQVDDNRWDVV
jgi:predicted metal-dependent HD superfamily phosphohydrolase